LARKGLKASLTSLCDNEVVIADVDQAEREPHETFSNVLRLRGPTLNLLFEQARISPEREGDTVVRDAFAGAIVTVLHDMLRRYWAAQSGSKAQWKHAGPKRNGCSVPQILAAALDNFRHFEEWDAEKPATLAQLRSVKVLCAALDIPLKKTAKHMPFRGNICWFVLDVLSAGEGYGHIDALVREFALALKRNC
jgi:hypothetical protein